MGGNGSSFIIWISKRYAGRFIMAESQRKIPFCWIENPYTPTRSGVWRYNRELKEHLLDTQTVDLVYSNETQALGVDQNSRRERILEILNEDPDVHSYPLLRFVSALSRNSSYVHKAARFVASMLGLDAFTTFMKSPFDFSAQAIPPDAIFHVTDQYIVSKMPRAMEQPYVVTVHDVMPVLSEELLGINLFQKKRHRKLYDFALEKIRQADGVIAVSGFTRETLVEHIGVDEQKIRVIYSGINHLRFSPGNVSGDFLRKYGILESDRIILHISNEAPQKNFETLLRAFAQVQANDGQAILVKVGDAHDAMQREQHIRICEELKIRHKVKFIGHVDDQELVYFYRAASVFVLPSLAEGFGLPVIEAQACGTAVVCSTQWALPEAGGDAAKLVAPDRVDEYAEAILTILGDHQVRDGMIARGIAHAAKFTWDQTAVDTIQFYRDVLGQQ